MLDSCAPAVKSDDSLAFQINRHIDADDIAYQLDTLGRAQIPLFLNADSAKTIYESLAQHTQWSLVFNLAGQHRETDARSLDAWSEADRNKLFALIHNAAVSKFQYCYETLPIYDIYHRKLMRGHLIHSMYELINSDDFIGLMRQVSRDDQISFADAQATRYRPGHFLTRHTDAVDGKCRRIAYVLNLSPIWSADWGGILQFFDASGNVTGGFSPAFNTLNLFRVPSEHAVSIVAPFAAANRISITGWLRSGPDPMAV
ncbi:MAG: 2OG-Fe(II) oxygenase family protein [Pseudomonadota bacterium]